MNADRRGPARWRVVLMLVVVFIAGGLTGAAIGRMGLRRELAANRGPGRTEPRAPKKELDVDQIPGPLLSLGLTPDEETRLHAIARQWRPRAGQEMAEVRARVADLENGMFADMLCVLTPAQRDQYMSWMQNAKMPADIVDKRFAVVRANTCPRQQ